MNSCAFDSLSKGASCKNGCGRTLRMDFNAHPTCECGRRQGVGDAVESFLSSHGITKEWYIEFKNKYGYPPTCDCDARREWLNKTAEAHPTIANIGVKFLAAITRKKP